MVISAAGATVAALLGFTKSTIGGSVWMSGDPVASVEANGDRVSRQPTAAPATHKKATTRTRGAERFGTPTVCRQGANLAMESD
jgi:hypothetical protein